MQSQQRTTPTVTSLVPFAPCVIVFHTETGNGWAILMRQCFAKHEDQGILRTKRQIHFAPQNKILLAIILIDAVRKRPPAKRVT